MKWKPDETEATDRDLGFGSEVANRTRLRLINPDGSFNVERYGLGWREKLSLYHQLLTLSWPRFIGLVVALYLIANALFALAYIASGPGGLSGSTAGSLPERFVETFFFSIQTFSTVGYGGIQPANLAANVVMTTEAITGLLAVALVTGLVFARFSRPMAHLLFSEHAVVAPYRGLTGFMFRIANSRRNQIVDLEARVILAARDPQRPGKRTFQGLALERKKVSFFPLSWTIVHPIDDDSPLAGLSSSDLEAMDAEFLVLLTGFDDTFSQNVHTRSSYKADELRWNARFSTMFVTTSEDQPLAIDVARIHDIESVPAEIETTEASS